MNVTVIRSGYVGLVAGACLADAGNHVQCLDVNAASFEIGNWEVFDAKITSTAQTASRRRSTSAFASMSSITVSMT